jgi:diacylglycerol O-acyltransferase 1
MDAAISSGVEATARAVNRATPDPPPPVEGNTDTKELKRALLRKYRHTAAVHSKVRPSTLSHDASQTPSFIGFRNLGLIVLSKLVSY